MLNIESPNSVLQVRSNKYILDELVSFRGCDRLDVRQEVTVSQTKRCCLNRLACKAVLSKSNLIDNLIHSLFS